MIPACLDSLSSPTLRGRPLPSVDEKSTTVFYFQIIHPDALSGGNFGKGRTQIQNLKTVLEDVLGHGNQNAMLPGQIEAGFRSRSDAAGGILFTEAEVREFNEINAKLGRPLWDPSKLTSA